MIAYSTLLSQKNLVFYLQINNQLKLKVSVGIPLFCITRKLAGTRNTAEITWIEITWLAPTKGNLIKIRRPKQTAV